MLQSISQLGIVIVDCIQDCIYFFSACWLKICLCDGLLLPQRVVLTEESLHIKAVVSLLVRMHFLLIYHSLEKAPGPRRNLRGLLEVKRFIRIYPFKPAERFTEMFLGESLLLDLLEAAGIVLFSCLLLKKLSSGL